MTLQEFLDKYTKGMKEYEIEQIQDYEIKKIARETAEYIKRTFLDETNISDSEAVILFRKAKEKEKEKLIEIYNTKYKEN